MTYSFSWDSKKAETNIKKHAVSFEEAGTVFIDPNARIIFDPDHSKTEDRYILLGLSSSLRLIAVCHCFRKNDNEIRIISARKANRKEQKEYRRFLS